MYASSSLRNPCTSLSALGIGHALVQQTHNLSYFEVLLYSSIAKDSMALERYLKKLDVAYRNRDATSMARCLSVQGDDTPFSRDFVPYLDQVRISTSVQDVLTIDGHRKLLQHFFKE